MYRFEQTGELSAESEDGRVYRILEYTKFLNLADAHTPSRWEAVGPEEYRSGMGERVVKLSETDFLILGRQRVRVTRIAGADLRERA